MSGLRLCECGCGRQTNLYRGEPCRFLPNHDKRKSPVEYVVDEATGCWVWQRVTTQDGYGHLKRDGRTVLAHRVFYERVNGRIPEGMVIDHLCRNPTCVNPDHMEVVTRGENQRRGARARLDPVTVAEVLALSADGLSRTAIAVKLSLSTTSVRRALTGTAWGASS